MSPIRSILVHLDASPRSDERLAVARAVAGTHDARVTGLYATMSNFQALPYAMAESALAGEAALELDARRLAEARESFARAMQRPGPTVEWTELDVEPMIPAVVQRALCADLVVLGQREVAAPYLFHLPEGFLASVIIDSGTPTLVVPRHGHFENAGRKVLVAWNATRESARALAASLPFLARAQSVDVVAWQDPNGPGTPDDRSRLEHHLRAHQVPATLHWFGSTPKDAGHELLSLAAHLGSDLVVMGCYGHSRAREWLFGGATRKVLDEMTLPVLMMH